MYTHIPTIPKERLRSRAPTRLLEMATVRLITPERATLRKQDRLLVLVRTWGAPSDNLRWQKFGNVEKETGLEHLKEAAANKPEYFDLKINGRDLTTPCLIQTSATVFSAREARLMDEETLRRH